MKKFLATGSGMLVLSGVLLLTGCSSNMFAKGAGGAAAGAVSAGLLGAVTDLIVDGSVNSSRLERNLVSGALAGGTAGAVVGHQQDQHQQARQAAAQPPAPSAREERRELEKKIGSENAAALNDLLYYRHEESFARTLKTTKSNKAEFRAAGYAIQALIDQDRGNKEGAEEALADFVDASSKVDSIEEARKGLKVLTDELKDERRVKGIRKP